MIVAYKHHLKDNRTIIKDENWFYPNIIFVCVNQCWNNFIILKIGQICKISVGVERGRGRRYLHDLSPHIVFKAPVSYNYFQVVRDIYKHLTLRNICTAEMSAK